MMIEMIYSILPLLAIYKGDILKITAQVVLYTEQKKFQMSCICQTEILLTYIDIILLRGIRFHLIQFIFYMWSFIKLHL